MKADASAVHYRYICAYTSTSGRALRLNSSFALNECVSRPIEHRLARALRNGHHRAAVLGLAQQDDAVELRKAINDVPISKADRPKARYSAKHSAAATTGLDLPAFVAALKALSTSDTAFSPAMPQGLRSSTTSIFNEEKNQML